ncbi:hypothetical protein [Staphylococcus equorum]|uniref:hypothetical protein n=1 Tax=Staphylococcus equorum TaxID=246432 RepID=UPI0039B0E757
MFQNFKNSFNQENNELLWIFMIIIPFVSIILSVIITFGAEDVFKLLEKLISLLITYFSISIGFSLATIVFIIDQLKNKKDEDEKEIVEQILSLIVIYIIHGIFMIAVFILELIFGGIYSFYGTTYIILNIIFLVFYFYMIMTNLYIFYKIIKVLYYFSTIVIKKL